MPSGTAADTGVVTDAAVAVVHAVAAADVGAIVDADDEANTRTRTKSDENSPPGLELSHLSTDHRHLVHRCHKAFDLQSQAHPYMVEAIQFQFEPKKYATNIIDGSPPPPKTS